MPCTTFLENAHRISVVFIVPATLLVAGLGLGSAVHADALSDLRMTLSKLSSQAPLQATLDVKSSTTSKKENGGKPELAEAHFAVQVGDGLSVHVGKTTLHLADTELQAAVGDADYPTPTAELLGNSVDPLTIEHLVARGPALLRLLASATAATASSTSLWGQPARELVIQLPPPKSKNVSLKDYQRTVSVWLDAAGMPLAYSDHTQFKACLLFFCATADNTESDRLEVVNGRLVASMTTRDRKMSGLGQDSDTHIVYLLNVKTASPAAGTAGPNSNQ
ncbi:MAG: hypothetical protein KGJ17_05670 [Gammaproteobacteria bacterium]|nr:hypothetical protein [Gammaproteobacteria bacterium]